MSVEALRLVAEFAAHPEFGVNACKASVPRDAADTVPPSVEIVEETTTGWVSRGETPREKGTAAPLLIFEVAQDAAWEPQVMTARNGARVSKAAIPIVVQYVARGKATEESIADASYTLRALRGVFAMFNEASQAAERGERNGVTVLRITDIRQAKVVAPKEDAIVLGAVFATVETLETVPRAVSPVATVTITGGDSLEPGGTTLLAASVLDANGQPVAVPPVWSSSDESIAVVSDAGLVIALAPGSVTISATAGGVSDDHIITVDATLTDEWSWDEAGTTALTYAYRGGIVPSDAGFVRIDGGTVTLPASSFSAVYRTAHGVVSVASKLTTSDTDVWFAAGAIPMQTVITDADGVVTVEDFRVPLQLAVTPAPSLDGVAVAAHGWVSGASAAMTATAADAAIAAAQAAGQTRIYFGAGVVNLAPAWWATVPDGFTVSGAGMSGDGDGGTSLKAPTLGPGQAPISLSLQTGITIEHFYIDSTGISGVSGSKGFQFLGCTDCTARHLRIAPGFNWGTFIGLQGATQSTGCVQEGCIIEGATGHGTEINGSDFNTMRRGYTTATVGQGFENYWQVGTTLRGTRCEDYVFDRCGESGVLDMGALDAVYERIYSLLSGSAGFAVTSSDLDINKVSRGGRARHVLISGSNADNVNAPGMNYVGHDWHFENVCVHRAGGAAGFTVNGQRGIWTGGGAWYAERTGIAGQLGAVDCRFHGGTILNPAAGAGAANNFDCLQTQGVVHLTSMYMDDTRTTRRARMWLFYNGAGSSGSAARYCTGGNVAQLRLFKSGGATPVIRECTGLTDEG